MKHLYGLAGFFIGLALALVLLPSQSASARPAPSDTPAPSPTAEVTMTPAPTAETPIAAATQTPTAAPSPTPGLPFIAAPVDVAPGITLGLDGEISCWNCAPFQPAINGEPVEIKLSYYTPWAGDGYSCWDWNEELNYCMSETATGLSWEAFYGFSAACPPDWPFGTWVAIEDVGAFICMDRGWEIVCHEGSTEEMARREKPHCHMDILGKALKLNQKHLKGTLWVSLNPRFQ